MLRARRGRRRPGGAHDTEERQNAEWPARAPGVRDDERHVASDEAEVVRRVADARPVARGDAGVDDRAAVRDDGAAEQCAEPSNAGPKAR